MQMAHYKLTIIIIIIIIIIIKFNSIWKMFKDSFKRLLIQWIIIELLVNYIWIISESHESEKECL